SSGSTTSSAAAAARLAPNGLLKWPREEAERYGPAFLLSLFAAILVWEEVWDLPHSAALSGCLLLLITAGAAACSAVFERRLWCRYLCPIGGMNGLMAKLAVTEVRARQGVCSGECSSYPCYRGSCPGPSPFQQGVTTYLPAFATSVSTRLRVGLGSSGSSTGAVTTSATTAASAAAVARSNSSSNAKQLNNWAGSNNTSNTRSSSSTGSSSSIAGGSRSPAVGSSGPRSDGGSDGGGGGLPSSGCPLYSHPAQLADNRNCTMCMECLRACPNGSVEVRLRPPGADLLGPHSASPGEVVLLFMLLGAVYLHNLPDLAAQLVQDATALHLSGVTPEHIAASLVLLTAPGALAWAADAANRLAATSAAAAAASTSSSSSSPIRSLLARVNLGRTETAAAAAALETTAGSHEAASQVLPPSHPVPLPAPFLTLSYGYLPLLWSATLAHYLRPLLAEAGQLLPVTAAMLGWEHASLPVAEAHPVVITFLQGSLLLFGAATSAALSRKLAAAPWVTFMPQLALIGLFTAEAWALILPHP
ncbi:hypothetical protein Agub_g6248, partial [Astrephomene gubernaculifera]